MPLVFFNSTYSGTTRTPPTTVSITPRAAGQLIVVIANNTSNLTSISISSSPSLRWTQQYFVNNGSGYGLGSIMVVWYAISTSNSPLSITVSSNATYTDVEAIAIDGANINAPFDTSSSFPAVATTSGATSLTTTFSTSGTNEMVIAAVGKANPPSNGISFSTSFGIPQFLDGTISSLDSYAYNVTLGPLSNATFTASWSGSDAAGMIVFAIVPAPVFIPPLSITGTFSTTSKNSLIIGCLIKNTANGDIGYLTSSIGQPTIMEINDADDGVSRALICGFNRVSESISNGTFEPFFTYPDFVSLSVIAIVPQQNIINSIIPQFDPSLSNATQFSSFFNPSAITNFSYSDAILPVGTQNRKYNFTLYSITNDQLEDLFRLLQQPSVQLIDVEGNSHTVVITYINPTYTGGLVGIYQVDIEAIEQNA